MVGFPKSLLISVIAGGTGIGIGVMVGWRTSSKDPPAQAIKSPSPMGLTNQQLAGSSPDSETTWVQSRQEMQRERPVNTEPQSIPTPVPQQANGVPLQPSRVPAVDGAGDPNVYKRLPGVPRPTLNLDGRDMTAEAMSMLSVRHDPVPFPGTANIPQTPAEAAPFPKTQEEMNALMEKLNQQAQEANPQAQQGTSPPQPQQ
jgi:hypothetical protein